MKHKVTREELLNTELSTYNPKKWGFNLPFINYNLMSEDLVPALSGSIGKAALIAAFAIAWAEGFKITNPIFVTENIRLELFIASILAIIFCAIINPYLAPPGTLAPFVPIIPMMVASGVHPLPLGILIGVIGLVLSVLKYLCKTITISGIGTRGGTILLFGILGVISSADHLRSWAYANNSGIIFIILLVIGLLAYLVLGMIGMRWMIVPLCALISLSVSALFNLYPSLNTSASLPIINPNLWWNELWGIGWGINGENFLKALPFALLAVIMWPLDALAVRTLQENNYPKNAKKAVFDINSSFLIISLRNIFGAVLGGSQTSAIWRSFMIPLATVKRPIGGSALILGIFGLAFSLLGFPIDIAIFPPLLWLVLIYGVYLPLVEIGLSTLKTAVHSQVATVCILVGITINPVLGWIASIITENFELIKDPQSSRVITKEDKVLTIIISILTIGSYSIAHML